MKKMTNKEISSLLLVLGVLAVVAAHMLVHTPNMDQVELLEIDIANQETEVARLRELEAQKPVMEEEIEKSKVIIESEMTKYPEEVLVEGFVMFAQNMKDTLEMDIQSVNIAAPTLLSQIEIMREQDGTNILMPMATYLTSLSMNCEFTYAQLKSMVEYVHDDAYRTVLNSVNISYNAATAQLMGDMNVNKYFVATPDYYYTPVVIPLVPTGNTNPFGTAIRG